MECEIYVGLCCNKEKETRESSAHQNAVAGCRQKLVSRDYRKLSRKWNLLAQAVSDFKWVIKITGKHKGQSLGDCLVEVPLEWCRGLDCVTKIQVRAHHTNCFLRVQMWFSISNKFSQGFAVKKQRCLGQKWLRHGKSLWNKVVVSRCRHLYHF